jgi:hypothetical protein
MENIPSETLLKIETYFHQLMRERAGNLIERHNLELPKLAPILRKTEWFAIQGMYGGFSYGLEVQDGEITLITESWSRVVEGSGQRHKITAQGIKLLEQGFV